MSSDWFVWADAADKWLIAFASLPGVVRPATSYWCIGHAAELYLKAVIVKATQSEESAVRFGHRIAGLLERCQEFDASFLPDYALRRTVLQEDVLLLRAASGMSKLSDDDREHFFRHEPLYVVAKHQGDLKYFPLRMKNRGTCCAVLVENWPDKYWIQFARDVRRYLQFPPDTRRDSIKEYIAGAPANGVSDEARDYLSQLYYSS